MVILLYAPPALGKTAAANSGLFADIPVVDTDRILEVLGADEDFTWETFHSDMRFYSKMLSKLRKFLASLAERDNVTYVFTNFHPKDLFLDGKNIFKSVYAFIPADAADYRKRLSKKFGSLPDWASYIPVGKDCDFADKTFIVQPGEFVADQIKNVPLRRY